MQNQRLAPRVRTLLPSAGVPRNSTHPSNLADAVNQSPDYRKGLETELNEIKFQKYSYMWFNRLKEYQQLLIEQV